MSHVIKLNSVKHFLFEMSITFHQTTDGENSTSVQNSGKMNLTVENSFNNNFNNCNNKIEISGNIRAIGSVGGSNVQSTVYAGPAFENPNTTGNIISCLRYHFSPSYCLFGSFTTFRKTQWSMKL